MSEISITPIIVDFTVTYGNAWGFDVDIAYDLSSYTITAGINYSTTDISGTISDQALSTGHFHVGWTSTQMQIGPTNYSYWVNAGYTSTSGTSEKWTLVAGKLAVKNYE